MRQPLPTTALSVVLALLLGSSACSQEPESSSSPDSPIGALIEQLPHVAEADIGYTATMSGSRFLPLGKSQTGTLLLGQSPPAASVTMRKLVAHGAAAIPELVAHLGDRRRTKIKFTHQSGFGAMFFADEYDYNRRTTAKPVDEKQGSLLDQANGPTSHTVTVGDLCFVALGQIVNRGFKAVRYQPTACIIVNSPSRSSRLRELIQAEWSNLSPQQHKQSLIRDFQEPDFEYRRIGAALRLGYYYPAELERLVIKQLEQPLFNVFEVHDLVRDELYPASTRAQRQARFKAFVTRVGEHARQGVLECLFDDLDIQEADEEGRLSPPLKEKYEARECLVELFGYPQTVKAQQKPVVVLDDETSQARFVDAIARFPSAKIDQAIRKILHRTNEDYLARACARYLVGRGADAEIRSYVATRMATADADKKLELERLLDQLGWTPLHVAAAEYENEVLVELLQGGADINVRAANGKTPLHVAAEHGSYGGLRVLIDHKAALNLKDNDGMTAIQRAQGYDSAIEILLSAGADVPDLLTAAFAGRSDLVERMLAADKSSANLRADNGETPLHRAAGRGHLKTVRLLLAAGAVVNKHDNDRNKLTPLHMAAGNGHGKVVALLLKHNADRTLKDWDGKTALVHARESFHSDVVRLLQAD